MLINNFGPYFDLVVVHGGEEPLTQIWARKRHMVHLNILESSGKVGGQFSQELSWLVCFSLNLSLNSELHSGNVVNACLLTYSIDTEDIYVRYILERSGSDELLK